MTPWESRHEDCSPGHLPWVKLSELRPGAIFVTHNGIRAVKSEYHYPYGGCECILLASGEAAHFAQDKTADRCGEAHNATPVREITLEQADERPTPVEQRADEIEAEAAKRICKLNMHDALRGAREAYEDIDRAISERSRDAQRVEAGAWLLVAQRMLEREAGR